MALLASHALSAMLIFLPADALPSEVLIASPVNSPSVLLAQNDLQGKRGSPPGGRRVLAIREVVRCAPETSAQPVPQLDPGTTSALPRMERFFARSHFQEDASPGSKVKILWLGATFVDRFIPQIEDIAEEIALRTYHLHAASSDNQVIAELGDHHETKLSHLWCLLVLQANGEAGHLLVNAIPNLFYIRDVGGVLRTVDVIWGGAGWEIGASSVEDRSRWPSGVLVVGP